MIVKLFLLRELKKYPFFFSLLFLTLFLGTLGLTGISIVSDQVKNKLKASARELLTSDLAVSARRDLLPEEVLALNRILSQIPHETYRLIDIYSMVRDEKSLQTRLVEIRSTEGGFPYYGHIQVDQGTFDREGLYLSKDLADLWSLSRGDRLKVGEKKFLVKGIVLKDSSQGLRGFSLAPRIYLPLKEVELTGLLRAGSTGSFARHFRISHFKEQDFENLKNDLLQVLPDAAVKVIRPEESSEQTGRVLNYLTDFMSLAALIGLILSLVGLFYLYQSHLAARLKDLCLFHLMGLPKNGLIFGIIFQFSVVFVLVYLAQLFMMIPLYQKMAPWLSVNLGLELSSEINLSSIYWLLPFLYGLAVLILAPLLMGLLRTPMGAQLKAAKISLGRFHFYDFIPFLVLLWITAIYLSHSFKMGSLFFIGLLMVFVFSTLLMKALQRVTKKLINPSSLLTPSLEVGLSLRNVIHSGHKLTLSFLSLAMGATLISVILQLDRMIQSEFTLGEKKPSLFIFDIQEDQIDALKQFALSKKVQLEGVSPLIRARIEKINGKAFLRQTESTSLRTREDEVDSRFRNRGLNLTYREELSAAEKIVAGKAFLKESPLPEGWAQISLEKRFAQRMGIKIGDRLSFDIQGIPFEGVVLNLREVKWTSFYPNFFVNVAPGTIDEAPKTYLAALPWSPRKMKQDFQREAVNKFPNVSFIDVEELILKLSQLFEKSRLAIEIISWLSLGVGLVILYGLSHDQVYRRFYDLALLKSLGLSSASLLKQLLIEFGLIFFLALFLGLGLGLLMANLIGLEVFKLSWSVDWERIIYPALFLSLMSIVTILLAARNVLKAHPKTLLSDS